MKESACNQDILNLLAGKASTKQLVFRQTKDVFKEFKALLKTIADELNSNICKIDKKVVVEYFDNGELEAEIRFSGDALIFHMHTNTFTFDKSHFTNQHSYIKKEPLNGYFGLISMYNFLADSLRYNRPNDVGHLLGRLFINREKQIINGTELTINHIKSKKEGEVFATARNIHKGRTTHLWEVKIVDEDNQLISICKMTNIILDKK